jgi:hypothetical protein
MQDHQARPKDLQVLRAQALRMAVLPYLQEAGVVTDYQTVARVRSCLRRKFSGIDPNKALFWVAVVLFFIALVIPAHA